MVRAAAICSAVLRNWGQTRNTHQQPLSLTPFKMPDPVSVPGNKSRLVFLKGQTLQQNTESRALPGGLWGRHPAFIRDPDTASPQSQRGF